MTLYLNILLFFNETMAKKIEVDKNFIKASLFISIAFYPSYILFKRCLVEHNIKLNNPYDSLPITSNCYIQSQQFKLFSATAFGEVKPQKQIIHTKDTVFYPFAICMGTKIQIPSLEGHKPIVDPCVKESAALENLLKDDIPEMTKYIVGIKKRINQLIDDPILSPCKRILESINRIRDDKDLDGFVKRYTDCIVPIRCPLEWKKVVDCLKMNSSCQDELIELYYCSYEVALLESKQEVEIIQKLAGIK